MNKYAMANKAPVIERVSGARDRLKSASMHKHVSNMLHDKWTVTEMCANTGCSLLRITKVIATIKANPEMFR